MDILEQNPHKTQSRFDAATPALGVGLAIAAGCLTAAIASNMTVAWDSALLKSARAVDESSAFRGWSWLSAAAWEITSLGGLFLVALLTLAASAWLFLKHRPACAMALLAAVASAEALGTVLKALLPRQRPVQLGRLLPSWEAGSFPSEFALRSTALYGTIALMIILSSRVECRLKLLAGGVATLVIASVGATRVVLGVEYPTDVAAGWLFGLLCVLMAMQLAQMTRLASAGAIQEQASSDVLPPSAAVTHDAPEGTAHSPAAVRGELMAVGAGHSRHEFASGGLEAVGFAGSEAPAWHSAPAVPAYLRREQSDTAEVEPLDVEEPSTATSAGRVRWLSSLRAGR